MHRSISYTYSVRWCAKRKCYVGRCHQVDHCHRWWRADSPMEALLGIGELVETLEELGDCRPDPEPEPEPEPVPEPEPEPERAVFDA